MLRKGTCLPGLPTRSWEMQKRRLLLLLLQACSLNRGIEKMPFRPRLTIKIALVWGTVAASTSPCFGQDKPTRVRERSELLCQSLMEFGSSLIVVGSEKTLEKSSLKALATLLKHADQVSAAGLTENSGGLEINLYVTMKNKQRIRYDVKQVSAGLWRVAEKEIRITASNPDDHSISLLFIDADDLARAMVPFFKNCSIHADCRKDMGALLKRGKGWKISTTSDQIDVFRGESDKLVLNKQHTTYQYIFASGK